MSIDASKQFCKFELAYSGHAEDVIISPIINEKLKFSQPGDSLFAEESSKAPARSRELGRGHIHLV